MLEVWEGISHKEGFWLSTSRKQNFMCKNDIKQLICDALEEKKNLIASFHQSFVEWVKMNPHPFQNAYSRPLDNLVVHALLPSNNEKASPLDLFASIPALTNHLHIV